MRDWVIKIQTPCKNGEVRSRLDRNSTRLIFGLRPRPCLRGFRWLSIPCFVTYVILLSSACGTSRVSLRPSPREFSYEDYEKIYKKWTRKADDFAILKFQEILHVTATFESWEFRWAYQVRYAHDFQMYPDAYEIAVENEKKDAGVRHRFLITLAGDNFRESDLTSQQHAWKVLFLNSSGDVFEPVEIQKISFPTPVEKTYFPSISPQRHTFRVWFPVTMKNGQPLIGHGDPFVTIRFVGPQGPKVDLRWDLSS